MHPTWEWKPVELNGDRRHESSGLKGMGDPEDEEDDEEEKKKSEDDEDEDDVMMMRREEEKKRGE
jgi:hypothetical protein